MKIIISNKLILFDIPDSLRRQLVQTLTMINPKWEENERMGRWNKGVPKILKYYEYTSAQGMSIPRGMAREILMACKNQNIEFEMDDKRRVLPEVEIDFTGTLKPFQKKAVNAMLPREFGTLCAPTGSGKTVMALNIIAARRQPAIVIVHTRDLAFQWMKQVESLLNIPSEDIGLIGAGEKRIGEKITIALVQSLYKIADAIYKDFGFVVVDECHRIPSRTFTEALTAFDSRYMLGLTATPYRRDKLSRLIFWHLGDVRHEVDKSALVKNGHILDAEIIFRISDFIPYSDPVNEYTKMLSELVADDKRNHLIVSDIAREAEKKSGVILVLTDRKKHCHTLQAILKYRYKLESELLTGDLSMKKRKDLIERLNNNRIDILIATGQLIGEGFDCDRLSTLFIATPIRFSGRLLQYLGRVLRPSPGKTKARVFDYVDKNVGPLEAAARARQRVYRMDEK